jgi:hypothetical protein
MESSSSDDKRRFFSLYLFDLDLDPGEWKLAEVSVIPNGHCPGCQDFIACLPGA